MIIRNNAIEAELYFDDDGDFVVNIISPTEVVLPDGRVAYVNKADEPFIVGVDSDQIEKELDMLVEFICDKTKRLPQLSS